MSATLDVPMRLAEVTPGWLTEALSDHWPGVEVVAVEADEPIHGTATNALLHVRYRTSDRYDDLPPTIWVKAGFEEHHDITGQFGVYVHEALFYRELGSRLPIEIPKCYAVRIDAARNQGIVLQEDLSARGVEFGHATRPVPPAAAFGVLDSLARLHALHWGRSWMDGVHWITPGIPMDGPGAAWFKQQTPGDFAKYIAERPEANVPEAVNDPDRIIAAFWRLAELSQEEPRCLIHSDAHIDNIYFLADGTPGFLDWQAPRVGCWAWDVNYFLGSGLTVEDRRTAERDLLRHYLDRLGAYGAPAPSFDDAWLWYRRYSAYNLFVKIVNPDYFKPREVNVAWMEKAVWQAADLDLFESLGV